MKGIALLADRHTATCFKLAGLNNIIKVNNAKEAEKNVLELLENKNLRIILISERFLNEMQILENTVEQQYPLVIPIPDLEGSTVLKTDFIAETIKRKTGIEVKF